MIALLLAAALFADTSARTPAPEPASIRTADQPQKEPALALSAVTVTVECTARSSGRVENCHVLGETHPGFGFGEAAIALMEEAQVAPPQTDIQFARTIQFTP